MFILFIEAYGYTVRSEYQETRESQVDANKVGYGVSSYISFSKSKAWTRASTHLVEANVLAVLTEALTAEIEAVFTDETSLVCAPAADYAHKREERPHNVKSSKWALDGQRGGVLSASRTSEMTDARRKRTIAWNPFQTCEDE
ncbi:hypothetical protein FRC18_001179 [Serendipita sp. 400]|nr:hypothetical protein FRC18_001179 [Serendipita sp. 400]